MKYRIGILGAGRMGGAFYNAFRKLGYRVHRYDLNSKKSDFRDFESFCNYTDIIFVCIKPFDVKDFLTHAEKYRNRVFVTAAAGVGLDVYEKNGFKNVLRIMPNINVMSLNGVIAASKGRYLKKKYFLILKRLLSRCGYFFLVDEKQMDLITVISGSGPAYFFYIADAIKEFAAKNGVKNTREIISHLLKGCGETALNSNMDFSELMNMVISPKGITFAAVNSFEKDKIKCKIIMGLRKALLKANKLKDAVKN